MGRTIKSTGPSSEICQYYFTQLDDDGISWECRKCSNVKRKSGGWTNLHSHLKSCVGADYRDQFKSVIDAGAAVGGVFHKNNKVIARGASEGRIAGSASQGLKLDGFIVRVSDAEMEMYEWINYLVIKNMPISHVDCPYTRRITKMKAVSSKSVRKHILSLVALVRQKITLRLPDKFVIIFDGWTEGTDHYIGIWASYNTIDNGIKDEYGHGKEIPVQSLLSMKPLLADGVKGMTAQDHLTHISRILQLYGKQTANVICLVGDNCKVNQSLARAMSVPHIGCGSHKFNLAVQKWIKEQPNLTDIIAKIAAVMKKASTLKVAAKLAQFTSYACVKANETRWSSSYNMVERFFQIQPQLNAVVELLELLPTPVEVDTLLRGFRTLSSFESITKALQHDGIPFVEVRSTFDMLIEDFRDMDLEHHLGPESSLVIDKNFEAGVMAIAEGVPLSLQQQAAVVNLIKTGHGRGGHGTMETSARMEGEVADDNEESYAARVAKRLKIQKFENSIGRHQYVNIQVIPGTSVFCERLFSLAKHILTDTRKNTSPMLFEALIF